jgi:hypothetical protein
MPTPGQSIRAGGGAFACVACVSDGTFEHPLAIRLFLDHHFSGFNHYQYCIAHLQV